MKKLLGIAIVFLAACLVLGSCIVENEPPDLGNVNAHPAYGDGTFSETVEGTGTGYGGQMTVTLKMNAGMIETIDVTHAETPAIGGRFIDRVKPQIVAANSFEIDAMTSPSCTFTRDGLRAAGAAALGKIPGNEPAEE